MNKHTRYSEIDAFETRDGSLIRELMHPQHHASNNQSLAEASVPIGVITKLHQHNLSEELYYIAQGTGEMRLGDELFTVMQGDTVCIKPGTPHCIKNTGNELLKILCCCSPPYSHADTVLLS